MSVRVRPRPPVVNRMVQTSVTDLDPSTVGQAHARVVEGIEQLEGNQSARSKVTASLVAGANIVNHGLGRVPTAVHVTPTAAAADFGYAMTSADTKQATITTVGTTQPNATLEFS